MDGNFRECEHKQKTIEKEMWELQTAEWEDVSACLAGNAPSFKGNKVGKKNKQAESMS